MGHYSRGTYCPWSDMVGGSRWLDPLALLRHLFPALPLTPLAIEVMLSAWLPWS